MSQILFPNDQTRATIASAVAAGKKILWILNRVQSLYFNPAITKGDIAGVFPTPSDGGAAFNPDYIVQNGDTGFAAAASAAGLFEWDGTLTEVADDAAALTVLTGVTVLSPNTVVG
jgi:hypothetical protein